MGYLYMLITTNFHLCIYLFYFSNFSIFTRIKLSTVPQSSPSLLSFESPDSSGIETLSTVTTLPLFMSLSIFPNLKVSLKLFPRDSSKIEFMSVPHCRTTLLPVHYVCRDIVTPNSSNVVFSISLYQFSEPIRFLNLTDPCSNSLQQLLMGWLETTSVPETSG